MKNHKLAKSIASVGWSSFFQKLEYKLKKKGGFIIRVERFFPSSQLCSHCGEKNPGTKNLSVRKWTCPKCGTEHDRDENAKQNLLAEGFRILRESGYKITGMEMIPYVAPAA
jgi:putative transposase